MSNSESHFPSLNVELVLAYCQCANISAVNEYVSLSGIREAFQRNAFYSCNL